MCGIFGLLQPTPIKSIELLEMSRMLRHRGPDDEGFLFAGPRGISVCYGPDTLQSVRESVLPYAPKVSLASGLASSSGGIVLGHRRLSIIDLTPAGHQPLCYLDRYWITFNGEIYNYVELREELRSLGHSIEGGSDTAVILAAYHQWGTGCFSKFNGMWAIGILDLLDRSLVLSRDRFGVKPLYYVAADGHFHFASEIKAFTALENWKAKANLPRLLDYLIWNVMDHTAETCFDGVRQLPAGHFMRIDAAEVMSGSRDKKAISAMPQQWYALPEVGEKTSGDPELELKELLEDSVRLRMRADVPVGSCLSGGVDSSSIVCLMSKLLINLGVLGRLKTFNSKSSDKAFDETAYAEHVAEAAGAEAHYVNPSPDDLFSNLDEMIWHQDEPFLSASNVAQWMVFKAARSQGIIVMLDGQGADEILCGYRGFFGAYLAELFNRGKIGQWLNEVHALRSKIGFSFLKSFGYTMVYLQPSLLGVLGWIDGRIYSDRGWISREHRSAFDADPFARTNGRPCSAHEMSRLQICSTNLPMLLHWEDRNSMAASVEARVPFLDYRVVELCLRIPDKEKLGGGIPKAVLRRSMRGIVPDLVLDRNDKMGFLTAEPLWMKRDMPTRFRQELAAAVETLGGVVSDSLLLRFDKMVSGRNKYDPYFWRVICAGRWKDRFSVGL